jgi:hypothetical protein
VLALQIFDRTDLLLAVLPACARLHAATGAREEQARARSSRREHNGTSSEAKGSRGITIFFERSITRRYTSNESA